MAIDHLWYGIGWLSFGVLHSVLAGAAVKARLQRWTGRFYRLIYNAIATVHIAGVWLLGRHLFGTAPPFDLPRAATLAGDGLAVVGLVVIGVALLGYDRGRFLGTAQVFGPETAEDESLRTDGLHRYVRHPLYSGAFLVLWGQAQNEFGLATALWGSLYLVIGTMFEERRLVRLYGRTYREYRAKVPAFIPWRGRLNLDTA